MELFGTIVLFLAILSILVLVHELGHFWAARAFGVKVEEFGIGFPPRATGIQRGGTFYSLNWLPLGGFVKLKGEQGESQQDSDSFASLPIWKRLIILAAGVAMNFLVAIVLFSIGFIFGMPQAIDDGALNAAVRDEKIQITGVYPQTPAEKSGLKPGDAILMLDGSKIGAVTQVQEFMKTHEGKAVKIQVKRGEEVIEKEVTPIRLTEAGISGIGITLHHTGIISYPFFQAWWMGVVTTFVMTKTILVMLATALKNLAFDGFVGPVGIAAYTATATKLGYAYLLNLMAQISLSLAIFNFLPIPALDGGRALFAVVEKIRGRAMRAEIENIIHFLGFVLLIILLLVITFRDVTRLFRF
jgi:regulator of sigma E protease